MSGQSQNSFTGVDLSRLPPPQAIDELDFETLRSQWLAQFLDMAAEAGLTFDATLESDPVIKLIELGAYREMIWRAARNAGLRSVMVAYAQGSDLDQLGALLGVKRETIVTADPANGVAAVTETDEDFRRRLVLAPEGYSVAGPRGAYIFHALSADPDVLDASAISPAPGEVLVTVLSRTGNGASSPALVSKVEAALSADTIRPITDLVTVQSAQIVAFSITATLVFRPGPDKSLVQANAAASLDAFIASARGIGRTVTRAGIIGALMVEGMHNVLLTAPAADIPISNIEAPHCTSVTLVDGGYA